MAVSRIVSLIEDAAVEFITRDGINILMLSL